MREAIEDLARRQRKKEKRSHRKGMTDSDDSATGLGETSAGADTPIAGFEESDKSVTTATPVARRRTKPPRPRIPRRRHRQNRQMSSPQSPLPPIPEDHRRWHTTSSHPPGRRTTLTFSA